VVEIRTKRIRRNLRIVHLSDFHLGPIHGATYFARVIRRVKALRPDLVLITGDLLDSTERSTSVSFAVLNELDVPVFLTTGNHEHYIGLEEVSKILKKYNIRILRNEAIETNDIQIVGIDNTASRRHFVSILEKIDMNPNKFTVLMHHQPIALEDANKRGVDLMLAGHTHGGQVFMFTLIVRLFWKYSNGLYRYRDTYLNTSSGTGTWGPPLRLGSFNEITLIKLKSISLES